MVLQTLWSFKHYGPLNTMVLQTLWFFKHYGPSNTVVLLQLVQWHAMSCCQAHVPGSEAQSDRS